MEEASRRAIHQVIDHRLVGLDNCLALTMKCQGQNRIGGPTTGPLQLNCFIQVVIANARGHAPFLKPTNTWAGVMVRVRVRVRDRVRVRVRVRDRLRVRVRG